MFALYTDAKSVPRPKWLKSSLNRKKSGGAQENIASEIRNWYKNIAISVFQHNAINVQRIPFILADILDHHSLRYGCFWMKLIDGYCPSHFSGPVARCTFSTNTKYLPCQRWNYPIIRISYTLLSIALFIYFLIFLYHQHWTKHPGIRKTKTYEFKTLSLTLSINFYMLTIVNTTNLVSPDTLSTLLTLCLRKSNRIYQWVFYFPSKGTVIFGVNPNQTLKKQSGCQWFEELWHSYYIL